MEEGAYTLGSPNFDLSTTKVSQQNNAVLQVGSRDSSRGGKRGVEIQTNSNQASLDKPQLILITPTYTESHALRLVTV